MVRKAKAVSIMGGAPNSYKGATEKVPMLGGIHRQLECLHMSTLRLSRCTGGASAYIYHQASHQPHLPKQYKMIPDHPHC